MGRPTTKTDLINAASNSFEKLYHLMDALTEVQQTAEFGFGSEKGKEAHWARDKNLRDILIHLYEWHRLLLNWVEANQAGDPKPFIPVPYNWRTYGQLNDLFWKQHQETPLNKAKFLLFESHTTVLKMIDTFSNEELFSKGSLSWTGTSTLGSYCVSATASHYDWALKKLRSHIKLLNAQSDV